MIFWLRFKTLKRHLNYYLINLYITLISKCNGMSRKYIIKKIMFFVAAKLDGVKTYMRMRRVPTHLQVKVIKWFDYLWLTQKCSDEEKAVSCLPDKLKAEIAINVHLDTLKRFAFFVAEISFFLIFIFRIFSYYISFHNLTFTFDALSLLFWTKDERTEVIF